MRKQNKEKKKNRRSREAEISGILKLFQTKISRRLLNRVWRPCASEYIQKSENRTSREWKEIRKKRTRLVRKCEIRVRLTDEQGETVPCLHGGELLWGVIKSSGSCLALQEEPGRPWGQVRGWQNHSVNDRCRNEEKELRCCLSAPF